MTWKSVNDKQITPPDGDLIFTNGTTIYCGNFDKNWKDYQLGIIDAVTHFGPLPELLTFINDKPINNDYKGWTHDTAPATDEFVWVLNSDSKLNIAKFSGGWIDRTGVKLENILCSMLLPALPGKSPDK